MASHQHETRLEAYLPVREIARDKQSTKSWFHRFDKLRMQVACFETAQTLMRELVEPWATSLFSILAVRDELRQLD